MAIGDAEFVNHLALGPGGPPGESEQPESTVSN
jgi:hypothetical protein